MFPKASDMLYGWGLLFVLLASGVATLAFFSERLIILNWAMVLGTVMSTIGGVGAFLAIAGIIQARFIGHCCIAIGAGSAIMVVAWMALAGLGA